MTEPGIHLITQLYRPSDDDHYRRILSCIIGNASLNCVRRLTLVADSEAPSFNDPKITIVNLGHRATFADLLTINNDSLDQHECSHLALANSDIFLSSDLELLLARITQASTVAALTRHELSGELYPNPLVSQDLWLFRTQRFATPLLERCNLRLGIAGCENMFALALYSHGYNLWNPCMNCKIRHNDPAPRAEYPEWYYGFRLFLSPCRIEDVETQEPVYMQNHARSALQTTSEDVENFAVLGSWPGLLQGEQPASMPAGVSGRVMNLDTAQERWQRMETQLQKLGWQESHRRFPALAASSEEATAAGLPSAGYLGLWRTTMAVISDWLASTPEPGDLLHVLEDDAVLHPALPVALECLRSSEQEIDILFTDIYLNEQQYRLLRKLDQRRQIRGGEVMLLSNNLYTACAASFVLSVPGAIKLLKAMRDQDATGKIPDNDIFYKNLFRKKRLRGGITLPFFSTIEQLKDSAVQTDLNKVLGRSKQADLTLRRLFFKQCWTPQASGDIYLDDLMEALKPGLTSAQVENIIVEVISLGRRQGWLCDY